MSWLLLACLSVVYGKVSQGEVIVNNAQFVLLDSFCFDSQGGVFTIDYAIPDKRFPNQEILMFHDMDAPGGFPFVYKSKNSCKKKAAGVVRNGRLEADSLELRPEGRGITRSIKSVVPRWWYIVLANCETDGGLEGVGLLDYRMTFTNSDGNITTAGTYTAQFGKDQQGIYETSIFVLILLLAYLGVVAYLICRRRRDVTDVSYEVYMALFVIALVHFLEIVFQLSHRDAYAGDGIGHPLLEDAAIFLDVVVQLMMVALFVVVAKGKWVSTANIRGVRSVVQVMALYLACSIGLLVWAYTRFNIGLTFTIYSSAPGAIMVALRILTLLWLWTSAQTSWQRERDTRKRAFYVWFVLFATAWFISYPIVVLLSALMNTWNRRRTVWIVQQIVLLFAYWLWLGFFTLPGVTLRKNEVASEELEQEDPDLSAPKGATV